MSHTPLHGTLVDLLGALRAVHWHAWTTHWKCSGDSFYGTHLLFQRIYAGDGGGPNLEAQTDGLGERMVALYRSKVLLRSNFRYSSSAPKLQPSRPSFRLSTASAWTTSFGSWLMHGAP
jgi:DNA-binding ferritin-like protein